MRVFENVTKISWPDLLVAIGKIGRMPALIAGPQGALTAVAGLEGVSSSAITLGLGQSRALDAAPPNLSRLFLTEGSVHEAAYGPGDIMHFLYQTNQEPACRVFLMPPLSAPAQLAGSVAAPPADQKDPPSPYYGGQVVLRNRQGRSLVAAIGNVERFAAVLTLHVTGAKASVPSGWVRRPDVQALPLRLPLCRQIEYSDLGHITFQTSPDPDTPPDSAGIYPPGAGPF